MKQEVVQGFDLRCKLLRCEAARVPSGLDQFRYPQLHLYGTATWRSTIV